MDRNLSLGIDLGTSNSALAICRSEGEKPEILPILQTVSPGKLAECTLLPSALYIPHASEAGAGQFDLPWESEPPLVAGEYAREHGAAVSDRLVLSAKSWLCNPRIDRRGAVLPWQSEIGEQKISPLQASARLLSHLKCAFEHWFGEKGGSITAADCQIVVTVPASFDEVARSLTVSAAEQAGLGKVTLLEEPLAAFYAWIAENDRSWREQISPGDLVLVCDVGGGTADFTLIAVSEERDGTLRLDRISVGDHILLGGDNMDLALAVSLRAGLESSGKKLDRWQFLSLVQAARKAKEQIFSNPVRNEYPLALAGRGSSLFASALSTVLSRAQLESLVLDGFIPLTPVTEMPRERVSAGLQEYGLPYASDPALSRHLARFLRHSLETVRADVQLKGLLSRFEEYEKLGFIRPTHLLFNGGVFKAEPVRRRVRELVSSWCGSELPELEGAEFDLAVARGASSYGMTRLLGKGIRIRAKTLRSYYLGIESSMPAVPGYSPPVNALCVVPQGMEEGSSLDLPGREFGLVTGEPVEFRFFSSAVRAQDVVGAVVEDAESQLEETARLQVALPAPENRREVVPVCLNSRVSEVGALELWLQHTRSDQKWKLEFNVRAAGS